jgi:alcohol dehydrogenase class IV
MFAATLAGMSFGNAGVHLPHAMSYSVAGLNHRWVAKGYEKDNPMVPHGIAVVINAPAAFRFTAPTAAKRHMEAAAALGADVSGANLEDAGEILADQLIEMMKATGLPNGLKDIGFSEDDLPGLVNGGYAQSRLIAISPREPSEADMLSMYKNAMRYW